MSKPLFDDLPIGIDLGTAFSCIAVYRHGRAEIIPDENGKRLIPSLVYYDPAFGDVSIGETAADQAYQCYENCLRDIKRFMGRKYEDQFVKEYLQKGDLQFKLVEGEHEKVAFEVQIDKRPVKKTPEEVSAEILKYLKKMAESYLNQDVCKVVISIPAYFSNSQRKATQKAAQIAGLDLIRLITEPSAAGSYYVREKKIIGNIMVFDWGGGTLDVSFIKTKNNNKFEVQAVYGDTSLGGRDIDNILFNHFRNSDVNDHRSIKRLLNKSVQLKHKLSTSDKCKLQIEYFSQSSDLELALTRQKFEELNANIFQRAMDIVEYGVTDIGWQPSDVDHIVLVGGSTRIPKIRQLLQNYFNKQDFETDLNPDEAVAAGAALQAWRSKYFSKYTEEYKITEVSPLSLGLGDDDNCMVTFIPRNSPLPVTKTDNSFTTSENNQTCIEFPVYEGERKNCQFNNNLGNLLITDLPQKRAGDVTFDIIFHLDEDGILTVSAKETSSGKAQKLIVTMGEFRLSENRIKLSITESKRMQNEDDLFYTFVYQKQDFKLKCQQIQYDIKKIRSKSDQKCLRNACNQFLMDIEELEFTEGEKLKMKYKQFSSSILPILKKSNLPTDF